MVACAWHRDRDQALGPTPWRRRRASDAQRRTRPVDQLLHKPPQLRWRREAGDHLVIADAGPSQRLAFHRVARSGRALVMSAALVFDGVARLAVPVHKKEIDPLRVDAAVRCRIRRAEDFAERDLSHHAPGGIAGDDSSIQFGKHARLAPIEERLDREIGPHHDAKLTSGIQLPGHGLATAGLPWLWPIARTWLSPLPWHAVLLAPRQATHPENELLADDAEKGTHCKHADEKLRLPQKSDNLGRHGGTLASRHIRINCDNTARLTVQTASSVARRRRQNVTGMRTRSLGSPTAAP